MRAPAPKPVQTDPLVEYSNVVRQISGPLPPRSQDTVEPSNERDCDEGSGLISRPRLARGSPASVVKLPPTRIAPSRCNVTHATVAFGELGPGLNQGSTRP